MGPRRTARWSIIFRHRPRHRFLGRSVSTTQNVLVDIKPPVSPDITISYRDAQNNVVPLDLSETLRNPNAVLLLDWTAANDNSGIGEYLVAINTDAVPDLAALTTISGGAPRHLELTPTEATTYYAHLIAATRTATTASFAQSGRSTMMPAPRPISSPISTISIGR